VRQLAAVPRRRRHLHPPAGGRPEHRQPPCALNLQIPCVVVMSRLLGFIASDHRSPRRAALPAQHRRPSPQPSTARQARQRRPSHLLLIVHAPRCSSSRPKAVHILCTLTHSPLGSSFLFPIRPLTDDPHQARWSRWTPSSGPSSPSSAAPTVRMSCRPWVSCTHRAWTTRAVAALPRESSPCPPFSTFACWEILPCHRICSTFDRIVFLCQYRCAR
jgi:hypothetical protein